MKKIFTLFSALFITAAALAQIPNASFETWTSGGSGAYEDPDSWGTANATIHSALPGTYTTEKGTSSAPDGAAFVKLTSKTVATVVVPGIAVTGDLNVNIATMSYSVSGGFPYTTRSANLTGKWQHMGGSASDHGRVIIYLSKWNMTTSSRDTVAWADSTLTGSASAWSDFTIPLKYKSSTLSPDTGLIVLVSSSSSTPVANSFLSVDKLAFSGTVPTGVISVNALEATTAVFPNPASGIATVYYHSVLGKDLTIILSDVTGKIIETRNVRAIAGENSFPIDLKNAVPGTYIIQLKDENSVTQKKLIVK